MAERIKRRDDVISQRAKREYGDIEFADPANKNYPIDTPERVRAVWFYINHNDIAAR